MTDNYTTYCTLH